MSRTAFRDSGGLRRRLGVPPPSGQKPAIFADSPAKGARLDRRPPRSLDLTRLSCRLARRNAGRIHSALPPIPISLDSSEPRENRRQGPDRRGWRSAAGNRPDRENIPCREPPHRCSGATRPRKNVDLLTEAHEIVVRYQGGANAGHTVVAKGQTYKLSLIPSGILRPDVTCVVTGGVVLNPATILEEVDMLRGRGVEIGRNLMISDRTHVIFPWHFEEERILTQRVADGEAIGTTMRGIGPCYRDKVGRSGAVRLGDLYRPSLKQRIESIVKEKNALLSAAGGANFTPLDPAAILKQYQGFAERLKPHVADSPEFLLSALEQGRPTLFEGAQGSLLDVDHGTYPYVTSSNSSGVGISSGSGVPGRYLKRIIGVIKAYSTRVGGGPFPTEQDNDTGQHLRDRGNEYGTVTRRPRRCGWFDAVAVRYTARLSADMLAGLAGRAQRLPEIKIRGLRSRWS